MNDVSARDVQHGEHASQWFLGKSTDTFCPMGPWIVTADEIPDPQALDLSPGSVAPGWATTLSGLLGIGRGQKCAACGAAAKRRGGTGTHARAASGAAALGAGGGSPPAPPAPSPAAASPTT
jgi:hypothetical protein